MAVRPKPEFPAAPPWNSREGEIPPPQFTHIHADLTAWRPLIPRRGSVPGWEREPDQDSWRASCFQPYSSEDEEFEEGEEGEEAGIAKCSTY